MRRQMFQWLIRAGCLLLLTSLAACGSTPAQQSRYGAPDNLTGKSKKQSEHVIHVAKSMIGKPYKFGGASPRAGFDCSGLVYFSHRQSGIVLPRSSYAQYKASRPVSRRALKRGDLLFFRISSNKVSHVGIYLGKNRFVHAPSSGKRVSIAQLNSPYWSKRFIRGGRI